MKNYCRIRIAVALGILAPVIAPAAVIDAGTVAALSNALVIASTNREDDTINLTADYYLLSGTLTYNAGVGETNSLTLQSTNQAVLDGGGSCQCLYLYAQANTNKASITLSGLMIQNGFYMYEGGVIMKGAGAFIRTQRGDITVRNCEISECLAGADIYHSADAGGAYFRIEYDGTISLSNCVINHNTTAGLGGGIYMYANSGVKAVMRNNLFINNRITRPDGYGAGAYVYSSGSQLFAENNTFLTNQSQVALFVKMQTNTDMAWIQNNIFWSNAVCFAYSNDLHVLDDGDGSGVGATNYVFNNGVSFKSHEIQEFIFRKLLTGCG